MDSSDFEDERLRPKLVAEELINTMISDGTWEKFRVQIASELRMNGDYKKVKMRAQELLEKEEIKLILRNPKTTEEDVAQHIDKAGGYSQYRISLDRLLNPKDNEAGKAELSIAKDLEKTVSQLVDLYTKRINDEA
ncbi:hypothetical protein GPJ56_006664 [Histomonas meleagridis]|uniref:uncharacterized protein n=1 Tax=Histomonas meleagridis TaxID=135588 RepID=UPI0035599FD8|nr:hypothetical protein GPJ56_006664 [Histomonas meleagridis]KAH0805993.1 hypothetical protein GO595_001241 [Histomonas meleagridis]